VTTTKMSVPEVRERLYELANILGSTELRHLAEQLHRRSPARHAPAASRRMTQERAAAIREYAARNPGLTEHQIGVVFGVNQGRVSESLVGFRDGRTR